MAELKRLENMPPMSAESTVSRNYLDWLLAVPWKKKSKELRDLKFAENVLEPITTAWRRSRSASSSSWRCGGW